MIRLKFKRLTFPNIVLGGSIWHLRNPEIIPAGNPSLVLSVGRRSPPVARWIRQRSRGATRLVHFGRPWGRSEWFDLVVTTPEAEVQPPYLRAGLPAAG